MTPLRQRFIHDLQLRNRSPRTIQTYVHHLKEFACFFKTSPDRLTPEHARRYLLHVVHEKHASWSAYNQAVSALRFFYLVTCPSDTPVSRIPYGKRPKRLVPVRSRDEVARLLAAVRSPVIALLLRTIYATGMRLGEALALHPSQIDSRQMVLRVIGRGTRNVSSPCPPCCSKNSALTGSRCGRRAFCFRARARNGSYAPVRCSAPVRRSARSRDWRV